MRRGTMLLVTLMSLALAPCVGVARAHAASLIARPARHVHEPGHAGLLAARPAHPVHEPAHSPRHGARATVPHAARVMRGPRGNGRGAGISALPLAARATRAQTSNLLALDAPYTAASGPSGRLGDGRAPPRASPSRQPAPLPSAAAAPARRARSAGFAQTLAAFGAAAAPSTDLCGPRVFVRLGAECLPKMYTGSAPAPSLVHRVGGAVACL